MSGDRATKAAGHDNGTPQREASVVDLRGARVTYGTRTVLRGVDLLVRPGEVVAILGANGSGKSTLVKAILRLVPLAAGTVSLFGASHGRELRRQWRRIGYVPQRVGASSGVPATVGEIVASGRLARRGPLRPPSRADAAAVAAALAAVDLASLAGSSAHTLSGGQQQRTLIARALAAEPALLVLDEPAAGVDAASQSAFAGALRSSVDSGATVLLVAHELGPLAPLVTRAVVVHDGVIAHDGAVPQPAGEHADPRHEHVHPHAPADPRGIWSGQ